ncbi:pyridoxamine 5'-phosphate oxidase family protein [Caulobacter sp.]|uniref:2Fe-2S iron-sulfur cluster-binding protein n=1 Tax=Caulobacter sp. TaxID=78 RepID=UPI002B484B9B|nr:pyridoxamine 5'-phosphate oxidase family protein [Caulobacter sp.]HJV40871.1 pyridoxamine 5'-phosphate oxidase family protein [Caulobacter sp.]
MSTPPLPTWPHARSPFHAGEQAVQDRVGVRERIETLGRRVIRGEMPEQHQLFFAQLPFLVLGVRDEEGWPWATLIGGAPGFARALGPTRLAVGVLPHPEDPAAPGLRAGGAVGVLGIELPTRRRNRLNGRVQTADPLGFVISVDQSFGNCPQYIQTRAFEAAPPRDPKADGPVVSAPGLDDAARALITRADTFFIASAPPEQADDPVSGVDVSHRGGKPGFVRVEGDVLTVPDFVGNFLFNTLGNLTLDPRAGLVFPDFETGDLLHLAVTAEIIWEGPEVDAYAGAERLLRLTVARMARVPASLPMRARGEAGLSPFLEQTGAWSPQRKGDWAARDYKSLRVTRIVDETPLVRSLWLERADGAAPPSFKPGQFLTVRLPDAPGRLVRTYTLSDAPDGRAYRLSIKRQGAASTWLHQAKVGDLLEALPPNGDFMLDEQSSRPIVMISAGIGVTPMIAMLNGLLAQGTSRRDRPIWFFHGARSRREHAFAEHLARQAARHDALRLVTTYSAPEAGDLDTGALPGRIDLDLVRRTLPLDDYDIYLCGPPAFMQALFEGLPKLGVAPNRIRAEAFGPASVKMKTPGSRPAAVSPSNALVTFASSGKTTPWREGSLLDLAERSGLQPVFSCRMGVCGECRTAVLAGSVIYDDQPVADVAPGEALLCCARPATDLVLDL